jgi:hypothetical protein
MAILLLAPVVVVSARHWTQLDVWPFALLAAGCIWLGLRTAQSPHGGMKQSVMSWLAAIAFIDALILAALGRPWAALAAAGLGVATKLWHRRIMGT